MPGSTRAWDELRSRVSALAGAQVRVGIVGAAAGSQHSDSELTNAEVGTLHEFGIGVPERSFIRSTMRDPARRAEFEKLAERLCRGVVEGRMPVARAAGLFGTWGSAAIQGQITSGDGIAPPLAPSTIARKGSSRPLVDTGQLVRSISWVVVP